MNSYVLSLALVFFTTSCAHSVNDAPIVSTPTPTSAAAPVEKTRFAPKLRMPLPYSFSRQGVTVRVNSVEKMADKLQVSITLQETRQEKGDINTATLMVPQLSSASVLPFAGNSRGMPRVALDPGEKTTLDLYFAWPPAANTAEMPLIPFTTGKWWSSQDN